jgi:hypothetical protein
MLRRHCEDVGRDYEATYPLDLYQRLPAGRRQDPKGARSLARGGMSYDEYFRRSMVDTSEEVSERL